jgi:hypothetical protein
MNTLKSPTGDNERQPGQESWMEAGPLISRIEDSVKIHEHDAGRR